MANFDWERSGELPLPTTAPLHAQGTLDWITEHEDAAVERLFALVEQNQVAIAALAQAWRHTRRALHLAQTQLAEAERQLAARTEELRRPGSTASSSRRIH